MSDLTAFDDEARRLTRELRASAERVQLHREMPDFGARTVERGARHFAVELFFAVVIAAVVVGLILALPRQMPATPRPAGPTVPVVSPTETPSPSPVPAIPSTISAAGPLALYRTATAADGSVTLTARTYAGQIAGTLILPPSSSGFDVAPNGMRVLNGDQIIADSGEILGTVPAQFFEAALPPTWADD